MKLKYCLFLVMLAGSILGVCGQPVPGHRIYGYFTDLADNVIPGTHITITGNESGLIWEGDSNSEGYFDSGYLSRIAQGELLTAETSWEGNSVSVSSRGLGARTFFELKLPLIVGAKRRHRPGLNNVSVSVLGAGANLGSTSVITVSVKKIGDFRVVGVNVSLLGVPPSWNVSPAYGLFDLDRGDNASVAFTVSIPFGAVFVGNYDFAVRVTLEDNILEFPFVFVVKSICFSNSECGAGFICVKGVCEVNNLCFNGVKNDGEDDVDCGGPCLPCGVTTIPRPSLTTFPSLTTLPKTTSTLSVSGSCFNGVWDESEEGVDCGGPCPPCVKGRSAWALVGGISIFVVLVLLFIVLVFLWFRRVKKD
jgi:hypothetical protein